MSVSGLNPLQAKIEAMGQQAELKRMEQTLRERQGSGDRQELKKACQEFESLFIQKLWSNMRKTVPKSSLLHSKAEEQYMSMFDQAFAREMSQNGGIGLSEVLLQQLQSRLEASSTHVQTGEDEPVPLELEREPGAGQSLVSRRAASPEIMHQVESLAAEIEKRQAPVTGMNNGPHGETKGLQDDAVQRAWSSTELRHMSMPVQGEISSGFGWRTDPFSGEQAWHSGIDIAVEPGTPVKACWPGKVVFSGTRQGYGNLVIVEHANGWQSYYGHNRENLARNGDIVDPGQEIARSGSTGRSTGPHLHFELRQGQMAWDPMHIQRRILAGLEIGKKT